jgi:hypothetical protein
MAANIDRSSPSSQELLFDKQRLAFSVLVGIIAVFVNLLIDDVHTVSDALTSFLGASIVFRSDSGSPCSLSVEILGRIAVTYFRSE